MSKLKLEWLHSPSVTLWPNEPDLSNKGTITFTVLSAFVFAATVQKKKKKPYAILTIDTTPFALH